MLESAQDMHYLLLTSSMYLLATLSLFFLLLPFAFLLVLWDSKQIMYSVAVTRAGCGQPNSHALRRRLVSTMAHAFQPLISIVLAYDMLSTQGNMDILHNRHPMSDQGHVFLCTFNDLPHIDARHEQYMGPRWEPESAPPSGNAHRRA